MDYTLDWRQMFTTVVSLDNVLKFSKIVILEFTDSPTQILVGFLSRKTVGRATRTEHFSDDRLGKTLSQTTLPYIYLASLEQYYEALFW